MSDVSAMPGQFGGSYTDKDGVRRAFTPAVAKALWEQIESEDKQRAIDLPDARSAIEAMHRAYTRLKQLGWNDIIYCPKDGSVFEVIENGSTGIFDCFYSGKWPDGCWITMDGGDTYPSSAGPALFRKKLIAQADHSPDAGNMLAQSERDSADDGGAVT